MTPLPGPLGSGKIHAWRFNQKRFALTWDSRRWPQDTVRLHCHGRWERQSLIQEKRLTLVLIGHDWTKGERARAASILGQDATVLHWRPREDAVDRETTQKLTFSRSLELLGCSQGPQRIRIDVFLTVAVIDHLSARCNFTLRQAAKTAHRRRGVAMLWRRDRG